MNQNNNHTQPTWPAWLTIIMGLVTALCLAIRLDQPIMAFDLWWHMLIGKQFIATHSLIFDHSIFTWTEAIPHNTYNAWISQIILFLIYDSADLVGLVVFRYVVFFSCFLLAIHYAKRVEVLSHPLTWVIIALGMMFSWPVYLVKPEIFSVGSMAVMVWLFFYIRNTGDQARYLTYTIPAFLIFWVNSHGAFFIASLFFTGIIIGELLNVRFSPTQSMSPRLRFHLFFALALCFPALLINPYGYELPLDIIQTILTPSMHPESSIYAYQPTSAFNRAPYYMLDYLILSMLIFVFLIWQKIKHRETDWIVILVFVGYCALFTQMGRVTYFLSPILIFSGLDLLSYRNKSSAWSNARIGKTVIVAACISIIGLIGWRTWDDNRDGITQIDTTIRDRINLTNAPVDETAYIKKNISGKRIGNTYSEGGYLLYELWPDKKVLIDTREFPFRKWLKQHFAFQNGVNVEQYVTEHKANSWLINYGYIMPLIWFVESKEWKIAYLGPIGAVFVPATDTKHDTPIISPNIASITSYQRIALAYAGALQLDDMTFARRILDVAKKNLNPNSSINMVFTRELNTITQGYEAFYDGDYQTAITLLDKKTTYILASDKAIEARFKLATQYWNSGDFFNSRKWLISAYDKKPHFADLYNIMLADWHMRNFGKHENATLDDGINWHSLSKTIVNEETKLNIEYKTVIDTAKAMLNKSYSGKSGLISRFTLKHEKTE